jgi:hypothetical protein
MQTDPFALIRKRDTGVSTSFSEVLEHAEHRLDDEAGNTLTVSTIRDRDYADVPEDWREGLRRLNCMPTPAGAEQARWVQIVLDAHKFAWGCTGDPQLDRWSIGSLFGFDPAEPDLHSLVLDIRGGWVVSLSQDERGRDVAMIANGDRTRWHLRRPIDAAPLWAIPSDRKRK